MPGDTAVAGAQQEDAGGQRDAAGEHVGEREQPAVTVDRG